MLVTWVEDWKRRGQIDFYHIHVRVPAATQGFLYNKGCSPNLFFRQENIIACTYWFLLLWQEHDCCYFSLSSVSTSLATRSYRGVVFCSVEQRHTFVNSQSLNLLVTQRECLRLEGDLRDHLAWPSRVTHSQLPRTMFRQLLHISRMADCLFIFLLHIIQWSLFFPTPPYS